MRSVRGITFDVRPPVVLIRFLVLVTLLASSAPWFTALPWYGRLMASLALASYGAWRIGRVGRPALAVVEWASDGVWGVIDTHGEAFSARLDGFRVLGRAVLLRLSWAGGTQVVWLGPDNAADEALRVLRARLM